MIPPFEEPERKLAAILAADVVGFSRMMGADEMGTLERFERARAEVIDKAIAAHRGRIFKVIGDGLLVEFASVVQALRAAIAIQAELPVHAAALPPGQRIVLRIGVHQGDVLVQGTDLLGDGVNVASRLEALAPAGGICMSARVREDAAGKIALTVEDGGEQALKNIAQPMRVFLVRAPGPQGGAAPILGGAARSLVAVMVFASAGGVAAAAFAAGLSAAMVPALSHWPGLLAAPAAPAETAEGASPSPLEDAVRAALSIGAAYALQGAVRQEGETLVAALRVLDVATGQPVWSGRQTLVLDEPGAITEPALAGQMAAAIGAQLRPAEPPVGEPTLAAPFTGWAHRLVVVDSVAPGPEQGHVVVLAPARLVIGRQSPSDLVLPSAQVSRTHCQVDLTEDAVTVTDLRSTNGTYVNDDRIAAPTRLAPGAALKVGPYVMRYLRARGLDEADPEATMVAEG